jgi:hypothetical protein
MFTALLLWTPRTFAEFEVDLLRMRTREGMAIARAKGKLRRKQPKLSARQQRELARMAAPSSDPRQQARPGKPDRPWPRALEQPQGFRICAASPLPLIPARFFLGPRIRP